MGNNMGIGMGNSDGELFEEMNMGHFFEETFLVGTTTTELFVIFAASRVVFRIPK